ncbi:MAG: hypothetical protein ACI94Y_003580 [Maribacter sp.]|jgi:hypothetical protein
MEQPIFNMLRDKELNEQMRTQGYLVLPFLDEHEIQLFRQLHDKHHKNPPPAFYNSYFSTDIEYKKEVENLVKQYFEQKMTQYFHNCIIMGGMFVVKPPQQIEHFLPHQDWSFVDEEKSLSLSMWSPLQDVDDRNGNLKVLRGSHEFLKTIRGSGTPNVYKGHRAIIDEYMVSVPLKAGEALFFFNNLVHGSPPNTSNHSRICLGLTLLPKEKPLLYYYIDPEDKEQKLEQFSATESFYINYVHQRGSRPTDLESLGIIDFDFPVLTESELIEKSEVMNPNKQLSSKKNPERMDKSLGHIINQFKKLCGISK